MRLLIVEDEAPIAEVVAAYAGREGYDTLWAADGEAAMSLWEKQGADLVVLDLMLPKLSGTEVCRRIRVRSAVLCIFFSSNLTGSDTKFATI